MFFYFRSLYEHSGEPSLFTTIEENANAWVTSPYFDEGTEFSKTWSLQKWINSDKKAFPMQSSYSNIYFEGNTDADRNSDTYMTMRTARLANFQTAAEFESIAKYKYASMRMYARTVGSPGACTAMFVYRRDGDLATVHEADIEILTKDPKNFIHYTNQP